MGSKSSKPKRAKSPKPGKRASRKASKGQATEQRPQAVPPAAQASAARDAAAEVGSSVVRADAADASAQPRTSTNAATYASGDVSAAQPPSLALRSEIHAGKLHSPKRERMQSEVNSPKSKASPREASELRPQRTGPGGAVSEAGVASGHVRVASVQDADNAGGVPSPLAASIAEPELRSPTLQITSNPSAVLSSRHSLSPTGADIAAAFPPAPPPAAVDDTPLDVVPETHPLPVPDTDNAPAHVPGPAPDTDNAPAPEVAFDATPERPATAPQQGEIVPVADAARSGAGADARPSNLVSEMSEAYSTADGTGGPLVGDAITRNATMQSVPVSTAEDAAAAEDDAAEDDPDAELRRARAAVLGTVRERASEAALPEETPATTAVATASNTVGSEDGEGDAEDRAPRGSSAEPVPAPVTGEVALVSLEGGGAPVSLGGSGAQAPVTGSGAPASLEGGGAPVSLGGSGAQAPVTGSGAQASMTGGGAQASMTGGGAQASITGGGAQASITGGGAQASITGGGAQASITGGGAQASMTGANVEDIAVEVPAAATPAGAGEPRPVRPVTLPGAAPPARPPQRPPLPPLATPGGLAALPRDAYTSVAPAGAVGRSTTVPSGQWSSRLTGQLSNRTRHLLQSHPIIDMTVFDLRLFKTVQYHWWDGSVIDEQPRANLQSFRLRDVDQLPGSGAVSSAGGDSGSGSERSATAGPGAQAWAGDGLTERDVVELRAQALMDGMQLRSRLGIPIEEAIIPEEQRSGA
ncbi:unnamed protein product [Pedinophyceae sp. YPF-701]|nr:unnamed protein product [Pedinophyceae sp. YPF-701]